MTMQNPNKNRYEAMNRVTRRADTRTTQRGRHCVSVIRTGLLMGLLVWLFAYAETDIGPLRSRVFRLRHISSTAAEGFLRRLNIGTEYNTLSPEVIIVTSNRAQDLVKATAVLMLVDSESPVEIRPLMVPTEQVPAPTHEELIVRLRGLTIGTLLNAPPMGSPNPAIVDLFEGTLIGIGSVEVLDRIEAFVKTWKEEKTALTEPAKAEREETRPSLAEIAARIFGDEVSPETSAEPNQVEPAEAPTPTAAARVNTETAEAVEAAKAEPTPQTQPEQKPAISEESVPSGDEEQQAMEAVRSRREQMAGEGAEASDRGLLEALEMLLKTSEQAEQQAATEQPVEQDQGEAGIPVPQEPQESEVAEPNGAEVRTAGSRIVTRPVLPQEKADEELELTITLPEEVEIEALVELVGKQLGLNYMYDPAILRNQKVMLKIHDGTIRVRDLYSLLESVLRFRGFVMTRRDQLVTIARTQDVANVDPVLRKPDEPIQPGDVVVSSVFELEYIDANSARNMLTQMKLGADFVAIAETGTLIVTDYAFRMERIREVLKMIDVAGAPKDFQFRQVRYMQAGELVPKVKALAGEIQGVSITVASQAASVQPTAQPPATTAAERARQLAELRARQQAQARAQQEGQVSAQQTVYLEADERTNRVLMIGYAEELALVNQLIDSLDVPSHDLRFIREYTIQNVEATEVITVLNELGMAQVKISSMTDQTAAARPQSQRLTPQQQAALQQQQAAQSRQAAASGSTLDEPYISLRAATNSLLVNAAEEQHKAIELVISYVDVTQKDQRTIREYEIQFVDTQMILDTLADLRIISPQTTEAASQTRGGGATAARAGVQRSAQAEPEAAGPVSLPTPEGTEREITAAEPQIAVLPATNSLLIYATPRQHASIAMVIAHADRQRERTFAPYVVYALENQDPEELAEVLNKLIKETVDEATAAGTDAKPDARIQTRSTGRVILPSGEEERIRIIPDPKTYSLVVYANQRNQQWVGELIRELDEYRPQVLLDCTLVEIKRNDAFTYDLDLIAKTYGGTSLRSSQVGTVMEPFTSDNFLDARSAGGTATAFFDSEKVQALLNIVEDKGYGRIMAKPKLLVNDNQEGEIKTENTTSIARKSSQTIPGTAGTENIVTEDIAFEEYTSGITLTIKPHISKGEMLRLEITLNRKDFDFTRGESVTVAGDNYPRPPDLVSTDVTTVTTVPDGSTIIMGGLEKINQNKNHTKVPILGDLPLLGGLFRGINNKDEQSRLYVFVKANILRPGDQVEGLEDMRRVSEVNRRAFEELEKGFQDMQSWPGLKDQPMDPERVLDED